MERAASLREAALRELVGIGHVDGRGGTGDADGAGADGRGLGAHELFRQVGIYIHDGSWRNKLHRFLAESDGTG